MTLRSVVTSVLVLAVLVPAGAARAQSVDDLFDPTTLQDIQLFMAVRDLQTLRAHVHEDTYYTAELQYRGLRVRNIGIRSRGNTTRNPAKPSLRLDFNRYTTKGTFLGLSALVLDNSVQDPSLIRERIAMSFFSRMGVPAPRESYARLFINGTYQGVYTIVEALDAKLMTRLGDSAGYLFQFRLSDTKYLGEDLGNDFEPYTVKFERQNHDKDADTLVYTPIREMLRQLNGPNDAVYRQMVEKYFDLSQFVTHVAIETFLSQEDGVLGIYGMNNFFLYRQGSSNQHRIGPWDQDKVFASIESGIFERADENIWFRRAIAIPELRRQYLAVLEQCARSAVEDDWLMQEVVNSAALVDGAVRADRNKPSSNDEFDDAVEFFKEFARRRSAFVLAQLARERR
ncbi:MAG TPA: CotH kinase family protein [Vicinamibacterales bacterium]|jgi:spore coat protein H|nr:CotH kinase family protein [Vicinamibacterales bacterium]